MKTLILGVNGSMGQRYKAILNHLNIPFVGFDTDSDKTLQQAAQGCKRVIIATPTHTHKEVIFELLKSFRGPILCEKPVCKDLNELQKLLMECEIADCDLRMMMQYKKLYREDGIIGPSSYNYFRHGSDGIVWDCMQIIALAKSRVTIEETSPYWRCVINGQQLKLGLMDAAYVEYLEDWYKSPSLCVGPDEIYEVHSKVWRFENART